MKPAGSKRKGGAFERELVKLFESIGWTARKQPYSGARQDFPHDLRVVHPDKGPFIVEAKRRREPHKTLEKWRGSAEILILRADRDEPRVYLPWSIFKQLVGL